MNCIEVKELIPQYINGELDSITAEHVRAHISVCPECDKEYRFWLVLKNDISQSAYTPPETLKKGVSAQIAAEKRKRFLGGPFEKLVYAAACIMMIFVSIMFIGRIVSDGHVGDMEQPNNNVPSLSEFTGYIYLSSDVNLPDETVMDESNLLRFAGVWTASLRNGNLLTLEINEDGSAVACVEDSWGIKNYYDGEIEFKNGGVVELTQSDGDVSGKARITVFSEDHRICLGVVSGSVPWIENKGA